MGLSLGFTDLVVNKKSIKIMSTADDSLDNTLSKVPPITNNYPLNTAEIPKFYARRNLKNHSDSIESFCKCESGIILLFYSYQQTNAQQLSHFLLEQCQLLDIFGKLRVSVEGFNCTLGGGDEQIARFIKVLLRIWRSSKRHRPPQRLPLSTIAGHWQSCKNLPIFRCLLQCGKVSLVSNS